MKKFKSTGFIFMIILVAMFLQGCAGKIPAEVSRYISGGTAQGPHTVMVNYEGGAWCTEQYENASLASITVVTCGEVLGQPWHARYDYRHPELKWQVNPEWVAPVE